MDDHGEEVEEQLDGEIPGQRLSTIRESMDSSSVNSASFASQSFSDFQSEPENLRSSLKNDTLQTNLCTNGLVIPSQGIRRPIRHLMLKPDTARPLSPISSSNETTPTESPAQRPRFLTFQNALTKKLSRTLLNNVTSVSASTPSPMEPKPIFEAESPDELALVEAAYLYNCRLIKRSPQSLTVMMPGNLV